MDYKAKDRFLFFDRYVKNIIMILKFLIPIFIFLTSLVSCEQEVSEKDIQEYKKTMDVRLGHLGNAIIIQGRLLDAFNLSNDRSDENHFKEAEELVKNHISSFGEPESLRRLKIPNSNKLRQLHNSLIETSELLIAASNALEDNAWLGGSVSYAEVNLEKARFNFQKAVKIIYGVNDGKGIKPEMQYEEYDVGEVPDSKAKTK